MVTGPNVMMGYWNNEEATKEVIIEPGTFRTETSVNSPRTATSPSPVV